MRFPSSGLLAAASVVAIATIMFGCETDQETARRFPRTDEPARRVKSELKSIRLANGVSVYLQEEHTDERVAVEVLYRAGLIHEPAGMLQVAHMAEHVVLMSGTASYGPREAVEKVRRYGGAAAEAAGDCTHYSYIAIGEKLDEILGIEAERLTSLRVEPDVVAAEADHAAAEIPSTVSKGNSLLRFGIVAMNQVLNHGETYAPVEAAIHLLAPDQIKSFHDTYYRPDDMVISVIGGFKMEEAEQLVRKHFENIPSRPAPPAPTAMITESVPATWDIPAEVTFLVFPSPGATQKERLALTILGSHLHRQIAASEELFQSMAAVYASNYTYPVRDLPFFIFLQAQPRQPLSSLRDEVLRIAQQALSEVDDKTAESLRTGAQSHMTATMLKDFDTFSIPHHRTIGQEALNNGLKHYLREGLSVEEFVALVGDISAEDYRAVIDKYLVPANMIEISFRGGR